MLPKPMVFLFRCKKVEQNVAQIKGFLTQVQFKLSQFSEIQVKFSTSRGGSAKKEVEPIKQDHLRRM